MTPKARTTRERPPKPRNKQNGAERRQRPRRRSHEATSKRKKTTNKDEDEPKNKSRVNRAAIPSRRTATHRSVLCVKLYGGGKPHAELGAGTRLSECSSLLPASPPHLFTCWFAHVHCTPFSSTWTQERSYSTPPRRKGGRRKEGRKEGTLSDGTNARRERTNNNQRSNESYEATKFDSFVRSFVRLVIVSE